MDNEEPIVWHEPIFNQYWDKIKQRKTVTNFCDIQIENVEIRKERLATLVTALSEQVNTTEFILFNNTILIQEGIVWLSKLVDVSSQLQTFCLH